jgi:hypothetical protein
VKLSVPFVYKAVGVKQGCRKPDAVWVLGREEVEIAEVGGEAAPVAVRVEGGRDFMDKSDRRIAGAPEPQPLEAREFGGGLVKRAEMHLWEILTADGHRSRTAQAPWEPLTADTAQAAFDVWAQWVATPTDHTVTRYFESPPPLGKLAGWQPRATDERAMRWRQPPDLSDREAQAAALREAAARSAFVDGALWTPTDGFVWEVEHRRVFLVGESVFVRVREAAAFKSRWHDGVFPIGQRDLAMEKARELSAANGGIGIDAQAARLAFERKTGTGGGHRRAALTRCACDLLRDVGGKQMVCLPTGLVRAWADLRDAVAGWPTALEGNGTARGVELVATLDAAWAEYKRDNREPVPESALEAWRRLVDAAEGREHVAGATELGADDLAAMGLLPGRKP